MTKSLLGLALLGAMSVAFAQSPKNDFDEANGKLPVAVVVPLDQAWKQLPSYKFGDSRAALNSITAEVVMSPKTSARRDMLTGQLTSVLADGKASKDARKFACRQLALLGGPAAVKPLNFLLLGDDADLSFMARYALERNDSPEALTALRDALPKTKGLVQIGVINSLAVLGDIDSIDDLVALASSPDPAIAGAVLSAVGKIGVGKALIMLSIVKIRPGSPLLAVLQRARLDSAKKLLLRSSLETVAPIYQSIFEDGVTPALRVAGWRGLARAKGDLAAPLVMEALKSTDRVMVGAAAGMMTELPPVVTSSVANSLSLLPAYSQATVLAVMAGMPGPAVLAAAIEALKSPDENVRVAALGALAGSGGAASIADLARLAASGSPRERPAAQSALEKLRGADVDAALAAQMEKSDAPQRVILAKTLGARRASNAAMTLLKLSTDADENVRVAALESLALVGSANEVSELLNWQAKAVTKGGRELTAVEKAVSATALSNPAKDERADVILAALNGADAARKASLLRVSGTIGGAKANAALLAALKDGDAAVRDAAVRALASSTDQSVAPTLLDLAQNGEKPVYKVLAFRGYVRLAGDTTLKSAARLAMYQAALAVAPVDEKKSVVAGCGTLGSLDALKAVAPLLDDEALREEAAVAINAIATKITGGNLADDAKEPLRAALKKVVETSKNDAARKQATEILKKV